MSSHYGGLRDHCVGTRLESHRIENKRGKVVGRTELWYSRATGGQNCVMTYNRAGKPFTRTYIWRLKRKGGLADAAAGDSGFGSYYAGGSFVNNTNGRCVTWAARSATPPGSATRTASIAAERAALTLTIGVR